jgi:hypothetical protein
VANPNLYSVITDHGFCIVVEGDSYRKTLASSGDGRQEVLKLFLMPVTVTVVITNV